MASTRAYIRQMIDVSDDLRIRFQFDTDFPVEAHVRRQDGYMWVELYDMSAADFDDVRLLGTSPAFGDYYAGKGCCPASVREHVAKLVERCGIF